MSTITIRTLTESPKPILLIEGETNLVANLKFRCDAYWLIDQLDPDHKYDLLGSKFRGVGIDRLAQVLSTGIDVVPSDAPIFADRLDKALEYGGVPKVVLALDPTKLDRTFREVSANTDPDAIAELKKTFPTEIKSDCGTMLWLTKLSFEDRRATKSYERDYAWWIPGNSMEALRAVLLFTDSIQAVTDPLSAFIVQHGATARES